MYPLTIRKDSFCPASGWLNWPLPTSTNPGQKLLDSYCQLTQIWKAIRERCAIALNNTAWPPSFPIWQDGINITAIADDSGGATAGTIRITFAAALLDGVGWIDGSAVKRWTSFGGLYNGSDLSDYAPSSYKLAIYPADTGTPPATELGDPNFGHVANITDNGDDWVEIPDDGRLTLNGLSLSSYIGFAGQIIGHGAYTENQGYGFPQRYPPRPNDPELDYGEITAATLGSITDDRDAGDDGFNTPKAWTAATLANMEAIFKVGTKWVRVPITGVSSISTFLFAAQATAPSGEYWIVPKGSWFRPEFRLYVRGITTRSGTEWERFNNGGHPWDADGFIPWAISSTWYSGWSDTYWRTHDPADDSLQAIKRFTEQITRSQGSGICDANATVTVFDADATIFKEDTCGFGGSLFNPWIFQSLRGLQVGIEGLLAGADWVEPNKSYQGLRAIPSWTQATWRKYWQPENTRTVTIAAIAGSDAVISITMPQATPQQGLYTALACDFTVLDEDGDVLLTDTGTVTAGTLTPDNITFVDPDHVGLTVVIAFGWSRRFERRVRYLYPRTIIVAESVPPTPLDPGSYSTTAASSNYAEYEKYGSIGDTGPAFIAGEAARYVADNYQDPTLTTASAFDTFLDLAYQGRPNVTAVSDFPRWEGTTRTGTVEAAGSFYLEDTTQLWELGDEESTLKEHTGTADGGSETTLTDSTMSADPYWSVVDRFKGMILEVSFDGGVTYHFRPVTAYNSGTQTLTVSPPFPASCNARAYRIREPGYSSRGAILNLWQGRKLKLTKTGTGEISYTTITYSDKHRLYFAAGSLGPAAGDTYEIIQLDPGAVLQYQPAADAAKKHGAGWVVMEDAAQDTRGANWLLGSARRAWNCPTIVRQFGRFRCGDMPLDHFWNDCFKAVDCLRWVKYLPTWTANGEINYKTNTVRGLAPASQWTTVWNQLISEWMAASGAEYIETISDAAPRALASGQVDLDPASGSVTAEDRWAYPLAENLPTLLNSTLEIYVHAYYLAVGTDPCINEGDTSDYYDYSTGILDSVWSKQDTFANSSSATRQGTVKIGDASLAAVLSNLPTNPGDPSDAAPCFDTSRNARKGFIVDGVIAIAKFDVSGGLTYRT